MKTRKSEIQPLVRRMEFKFTGDIPRFWNGGDEVKTHFANAFSVLLPVYERLFIATVATALKDVHDPELRKQGQAFCGQEGQHAAVHGSYNRWLTTFGYRSVPRIEKLQRWFTDFMRRALPMTWMLSFAAATEHLTSYIAQQYLSFPEHWSGGAHPTLSALWRWHLAEELEHKAVCHDVFQAVSGKPWLRRMGLAAAITLVLGFMATNQLYFFAKDGLLFQPRIWKNYAKVMLGPGGLLQGVCREGMDYLRTDFHPWESLADESLIRAWRAGG